MSIKVTVPKKEEELEELPEKEELETEVEETVEENDERDLELENARLQGQVEVLSKKDAPASGQNSQEKARAQLLNDVNSLSEEQFSEIYHKSKTEVMATYLDHAVHTGNLETKERVASAEARMELTTKHGSDFLKYRKEVDAALQDASAEVKQDPERLARFMERQYLALKRENPPKVIKKKEGDDTVNRKKIVSDFEKPDPVAGEHVSEEAEKKKNDELSPQDYALGKHFGITTKSEAELHKGLYVPMDFGNGITFKDPAKGFEKVEPAK